MPFKLYKLAIWRISRADLMQMICWFHMTLSAFSVFLHLLLCLGMKKGKAHSLFPYGKDNHFLRQMQIWHQAFLHFSAILTGSKMNVEWISIHNAQCMIYNWFLLQQQSSYLSTCCLSVAFWLVFHVLKERLFPKRNGDCLELTSSILFRLIIDYSKMLMLFKIV